MPPSGLRVTSTCSANFGLGKGIQAQIDSSSWRRRAFTLVTCATRGLVLLICGAGTRGKTSPAPKHPYTCANGWYNLKHWFHHLSDRSSCRGRAPPRAVRSNPSSTDRGRKGLGGALPPTFPLYYPTPPKCRTWIPTRRPYEATLCAPTADFGLWRTATSGTTRRTGIPVRLFGGTPSCLAEPRADFSTRSARSK